MSEIRAFEASNTLGALLDRVEKGEEIVLTRDGKPVARLVPIEGRLDHQLAEAAAKRIHERARQFKGASFDWDVLKVDR